MRQHYTPEPKRRPSLARDFLHALIFAALIGAPRANLETESGYAQYFSSAEFARFTEDGTVDNWLRGMNELFKTFGRVPEVVDPKRYYLGARYIAAKV